MTGIAQNRARQAVLGAVGGGPGRLALRHDHRVEPGIEVVLVLGRQPLGPGHAAPAAEMAPEHQQRRPASPELREHALQARVIGEGKIGRYGPGRQA